MQLAEYDFSGVCRGKRVGLVFNDGNAGDSLIAVGIRHWLQDRGLDRIVTLHKDQVAGAELDILIFGGGGNLIPAYETGFATISIAYDQGMEVIVLPHTIHGREREWARMQDRLTVFCRERRSYEHMLQAGFPAERLGLDHDMAFAARQRLFSVRSSVHRGGTGWLMRVDDEKHPQRPPPPPENFDASLSWNGSFWHNEGLSHHVASSLIAYISQFERVVTDRLHVAIAAYRMGIPTSFYENRYYKNAAVHAYSMSSPGSSVTFFGHKDPAA